MRVSELYTHGARSKIPLIAIFFKGEMTNCIVTEAKNESLRHDRSTKYDKLP